MGDRKGKYNSRETGLHKARPLNFGGRHMELFLLLSGHFSPKEGFFLNNKNGQFGAETLESDRGSSLVFQECEGAKVKFTLSSKSQTLWYLWKILERDSASERIRKICTNPAKKT